MHTCKYWCRFQAPFTSNLDPAGLPYVLPHWNRRELESLAFISWAPGTIPPILGSSGTLSRWRSSFILKSSWLPLKFLRLLGRQLNNWTPLYWKLWSLSCWVGPPALVLSLGNLHFLPSLVSLSAPCPWGSCGSTWPVFLICPSSLFIFIYLQLLFML